MKFKRFIAIFLLVFCLSGEIFAQESNKNFTHGPRRQMATIIFAGLGGAVLGLSTLSFYGRPQEELSNIAIGFAVGVITGTIYMTYDKATTSPQYIGVDNVPAPQFSMSNYRPLDLREELDEAARTIPFAPLRFSQSF